MMDGNKGEDREERLSTAAASAAAALVLRVRKDVNLMGNGIKVFMCVSAMSRNLILEEIAYCFSPRWGGGHPKE